MHAASGNSQAECVRRLNARLDKQYTSSRMYEWREGKRAVPEEVAVVMREEALSWLLDREGLTDDEQQKFRRVLSVVLR
jgi:hypothetical protein